MTVTALAPPRASLTAGNGETGVGDSPLIPIFTDPSLSSAAEMLGTFISVFHELTPAVMLEEPRKSIRGSGKGDTKIMLPTISLDPDETTEDDLDLVFHVLKTQVQIIREHVANPDEEFMLVYESNDVQSVDSMRFRSPRFADRIPHSHVIAILPEFDEIDECVFANAFDRAVIRWWKS